MRKIQGAGFCHLSRFMKGNKFLFNFIFLRQTKTNSHWSAIHWPPRFSPSLLHLTWKWLNFRCNATNWKPKESNELYSFAFAPESAQKLWLLHLSLRWGRCVCLLFLFFCKLHCIITVLGFKSFQKLGRIRVNFINIWLEGARLNISSDFAHVGYPWRLVLFLQHSLCWRWREQRRCIWKSGW